MPDLRISEVSSRTGVPSSTLRYYEQVGLLPAARTPAGYRVYDERSVERLRFIGAAKRLRLSLDSIRALLRAWEDQPCRTVKSQLRPMVTARLAETRRGIEALTELADTLQAGLRRLDELPDRDHACDPSCAFLADAPPESAASGPADAATGRDRASGVEATHVPVACSLSPGDQHARLAQWHALLQDAAVDRSTDGVIIDLPVSTAGQLSELITAEQVCCPFLAFTVSFQPTRLRVTVTAEDPILVEDLLPAGARR